MCLGIPVEIVEIKEDNKALCNYLGVNKEIDVRFVPKIKKGDFVILHAGSAIQIIDKESAKEIHTLLESIQ